MQLYPNPTEGDVRVIWDEMADGQIRLISPEGKEICRVDFVQAASVDIATKGLPQGWCTVVRLGRDGQVIETEKLFIK